MTVDRPGVYTLSAEDYHADNFLPEPSLSSSIAKLLVTRTPRHAWENHPRLNPNYEPEDSERFDIGKAAHSLTLHDPQKFEIIDAADWRTKEAKKARDDARAAGKIPLLAEQWDRVTAMAIAARVQLDRHEDASGAFTNGLPEQTLVFQEGGTWIRCRLDWRPFSGPFFDDLKSTECADPDAFQRIAISLGYDVQASLYLRAIKALGLHTKPVFRFIVQEVSPPFALSVVALAPGFIDLADRKVDRAIRLWAECLRSGVWPAYPTRTCWLDCPEWHEAAYLNREARDSDVAKAVNWDAPLEKRT